jgi:hypothetical protein
MVNWYIALTRKIDTHIFFPSLAGYSDKKLELLLFALKDLKMILKSQESDLLVGLGNAEDIILKLVNEVTMQGLCWELSLQILMHVQLLPSNTFRSPDCMHCRIAGATGTSGSYFYRRG